MDTGVSLVLGALGGGGVSGIISELVRRSAKRQEHELDALAAKDIAVTAHEAVRAEAERDRVLTMLQTLLQGQQQEIATNRTEIGHLRDALSQERIRCDQELAAHEKELERVRTTLGHVQDDFRRFREENTQIALEEAGRRVMSGFFREMHRTSGEIENELNPWDNETERRHGNERRQED